MTLDSSSISSHSSRHSSKHMLLKAANTQDKHPLPTLASTPTLVRDHPLLRDHHLTLNSNSNSHSLPKDRLITVSQLMEGTKSLLMALNTKDLNSTSSLLSSSMEEVPANTKGDHLHSRQLLLTAAVDSLLPMKVTSNNDLPSNLVMALSSSMEHLSSSIKATRDLHTRQLDLLTSSLCHGDQQHCDRHKPI